MESVSTTYYLGQATSPEFLFHHLQTRDNDSAHLMALFEISCEKVPVKYLIHDKHSIHINYYNIIIRVSRAERISFSLKYQMR